MLHCLSHLARLLHDTSVTFQPKMRCRCSKVIAFMATSFLGCAHFDRCGCWCPGGRPKIIKRHGLVFEDRPEGMTCLKLVRGLSNTQGQYNCFLNVIIQSLWHLPAFRSALLNLPSALSDNGASPKDTAVVRALHSVFTAFSTSPPDAQQAAAQRDAQVQSASAGSPSARQLQQQEQAESSTSAAASSPADAVRQSISPDELREALSKLEKGQSSIEFDLSEMHDAAEVITPTHLKLQTYAAFRTAIDPQIKHEALSMYIASHGA